MLCSNFHIENLQTWFLSPATVYVGFPTGFVNISMATVGIGVKHLHLACNVFPLTRQKLLDTLLLLDYLFHP